MVITDLRIPFMALLGLRILGSVFVSGQPTSVLKNRPREKIRPRVAYVLSVNCPRLMST